MIYIVEHSDVDRVHLPRLTGDLDGIVSCSLDQVPDGVEYYYYFNTDFSVFFTTDHMRSLSAVDPQYAATVRNNFCIPPQVFADVDSGRCRYIFDHATEGFFWARLDHLETIMGCNSSQYIWVSGDFQMKDVFPQVQYTNWWERNTAELLEREWNGTGKLAAGAPAVMPIPEINRMQWDLIENRTARPYTNTLYCRRIRPHRANLMIELHRRNLLDRMVWSWGGRVEGRSVEPNGREWHKTSRFFHDSSSQLLDSFNTVYSWGNTQHNKKAIENLHINLVNWIAHEDIHATNYQLIVETWATDGRGRFLSEKSFKPFLLLQPFLIWGDPYTIDTLKWYGYDTLDRWINHSYDRVTDPLNRLQMLVDETQRLNTLSASDWAQMLWEMRDALKHNLNNLQSANTRWSLF